MTFNHVLVVLSGFIAGSFLNVVIYRLPRGKSVVKPRSFCPQCSRNIRWYENIPVISYLCLKGRCKGCGSRIPASYPLVESIGGIMAYAVSYCFGFTVDALIIYAFIMALVAITLIDWKHRIIPDQISLSFIIIGLIWSIFTRRIDLSASVLGASVGAGVLYLIGFVYKGIRHTEGMGGGDVKLMAMIGAFLGIRLVLPVLVIASFFGSLYGVYLIRSGGSSKTTVAFGSFLAPAAGICIFCGQELVDWYFMRF